MATVNFSVPEDVKQEFLETFAKENRSAIIAQLMREAIDQRKRQQKRAAAIDALLKLRGRSRPISDEEIRRARRSGRP